MIPQNLSCPSVSEGDWFWGTPGRYQIRGCSHRLQQGRPPAPGGNQGQALSGHPRLGGPCGPGASCVFSQQRSPHHGGSSRSGPNTRLPRKAGWRGPRLASGSLAVGGSRHSLTRRLVVTSDTTETVQPLRKTVTVTKTLTERAPDATSTLNTTELHVTEFCGFTLSFQSKGREEDTSC